MQSKELEIFVKTHDIFSSRASNSGGRICARIEKFCGCLQQLYAAAQVPRFFRPLSWSALHRAAWATGIIHNSLFTTEVCEQRISILINIREPQSDISLWILVFFSIYRYPKFADAPPNKNINANRRFWLGCCVWFYRASKVLKNKTSNSLSF